MMVAAKLVEIKAGLSNLLDNKLVADPRKGKIEVIRDQDGLVHFTWSEREGNAGSKEEPEVDIVLFPGGGTFSKLPGRRMFLLKHHDEKLFFWAQERDGGQDDQHCTAVNECINSFTDADEEEPEEGEDMEEDEQMPAVEATTTPDAAVVQQPAAPSAAQPPAASGVQASDLARILGSLGVPQAAAAQAQAAGAPATGAIDARALAAALAGAASGSLQQQVQRAPGPSLTEVLTPEVMIPLLKEPGVLERLAPYMPEEHRNEAGLLDLAASAQLRHQISVLSMALQTAQLDPAQFGLKPTGYTIIEFLESIQRQADEGKRQ